MRNILTIMTLFTVYLLGAQDMATKVVMTDHSMDSMKSSKVLYCNTLSGGGKYLFNSAKNTRTTLAGLGYNLDEIAMEYQVRYKDFPKVFYFQQLGSLTNAKYVSINGFGVKEDIRKTIFSTDNIELTPYAEFGVGYYRLSASDNVSSSSINTVLNGSVNSYVLDNISVTGDLGLDLGFGFIFGERRLMLLLNGGFMTNFPTQWRSSGSIAFKEKLNIMSPYAGVTIRLDMACPDGCCK